MSAPGTDTLVPCRNDHAGTPGWMRVPLPLPLEVERDGVVYVLDDEPDGPIYVAVS